MVILFGILLFFGGIVGVVEVIVIVSLILVFYDKCN